MSSYYNAETHNVEHSPDEALEKVPSHHNDLGDWCPRSGERTADGTCPLFCEEADDLAGIDAGRDEDDDKDEDTA